jgi:hypothetical protein
VEIQKAPGLKSRQLSKDVEDGLRELIGMTILCPLVYAGDAQWFHCAWVRKTVACGYKQARDTPTHTGLQDVRECMKSHFA